MNERETEAGLLRELCNIYENALVSLEVDDPDLQIHYAEKAEATIKRILSLHSKSDGKDVGDEGEKLKEKALALNRRILEALEKAKTETSSKILEARRFKKMLGSIKERISGTRIDIKE